MYLDVYLYFTVFNKKNQNIQHLIYISITFFFLFCHDLKHKHTFYFYPLIPSCLNSVYIYIYCLYIPVLWLKQETFTDSLNQWKAQSGFFLSVQYFICLSQIGSAEIKDTHLHVQNFINKAHFSQKLIFFANKIFGYFDFCIVFFFI